MEGCETLVNTVRQVKEKNTMSCYNCLKCSCKHKLDQYPSYEKTWVVYKNKDHFAVVCKLNTASNSYDRKSNKTSNNFKQSSDIIRECQSEMSMHNVDCALDDTENSL